MGKQTQYSMVIQWSDDDRAYVVSLPEWAGRVLNPVTHGETYDEAVKNGPETIEALIASSDQLDEPLPEPNVLRHISSRYAGRRRRVGASLRPRPRPPHPKMTRASGAAKTRR